MRKKQKNGIKALLFGAAGAIAEQMFIWVRVQSEAARQGAVRIVGSCDRGNAI
ncbi:MAG: hypothetical protein IJV41_04910 [Oscillospiraceae bacterium]|nr:hypothetical protein [Oscillospiraceae bacterium]